MLGRTFVKHRISCQTNLLNHENLPHESRMKQTTSFSYCCLLGVEQSTSERMCCAISAEALSFAAFRALSDISAIFFSSPKTQAIEDIKHRQSKIYHFQIVSDHFRSSAMKFPYSSITDNTNYKQNLLKKSVNEFIAQGHETPNDVLLLFRKAESLHLIRLHIINLCIYCIIAV